jgi:hypothetical protein
LILSGIKTILEGVSSIKKVEVNRSSPVDIESVPFPCAFIYSGNETKITEGEYSVIGYENWEWIINVEVWYGEGDDGEELLESIHKAMYTDHSIGGNAVTSSRIRSEMFLLDPVRIINSMIIDYSVIYRHKNGIP